MPPTSKRRRDDDDDDDRRPRRKRPAPANNSALFWIIGGLVGGSALLILACGGVVLLLVATGKGNKDAGPPPPFAQQAIPNINQGNPQVDPARIIQASSVHFQVDPSPTIRDMIFAEQAGGVGYLFWDAQNGLKKMFEYWNYKTKVRLTRIELPDDGDSMDLSPQGSRLVVQKNKLLNIWALPGGQPIHPNWQPYPDGQLKPGNIPPQLIWACFLDENRLLTISMTAQFDLWDMTTKKNLYTSPPMQGRFVTTNGFARAPKDFAISPDRKKLALANGKGFDFFDTATGKKIGSTQIIPGQGQVGNIWALSFNRTGTLLALKGNFFKDGKQHESITLWEVPSGLQKSLHPVALDLNATGPIVWIGPRHLMILDGNRFKGHVFSLDQGRYQRVANLDHGDRFARQGPDERIWYICRGGFGTPSEVVAVDFPAQNLVQQPAPPGANLGDLPQWLFTPAGILRNGPN